VLYDINLPEINEVHTVGNNSTFEVEPLYPGCGMTLGNSMRRVLLSSLAGGAITGVKIEGVSHEFSAVPGVREDVIEIILNLKQVRFSNTHDEPITVSLKKTGKGEVTAADIKTVAGVEVANPEQVIANLDTSKSKIEMDLHIEQGRGYAAVESRASEKLPEGMIAIDAIYTPIKRVRYSVENTRVGQHFCWSS
jgi:DNA-directed RNA polymerase subunit alpha